MSGGTQAARGWSVDGWRAFWCDPSPEVALKRVPTVVTPDVEAVWPRIPGRLRGSGEYARRIVDLLTVVPDLCLELGEHAANGEFVLLRWGTRAGLHVGRCFDSRAPASCNPSCPQGRDVPPLRRAARDTTKGDR